MATFHPFPRLPYELRAMIWEATFEPRTLSVELRHELHGGVGDSAGVSLASSTPVPAVLQSCHEARNYGPYKKVFSELSTSGKGLGYVLILTRCIRMLINPRSYIWANLKHDVIEIRLSSACHFEAVAASITKLKFRINWSDVLGSRHYRDSRFGEELRRFVNVEQLYIETVENLYGCMEILKDRSWPCSNEEVYFIHPQDRRLVLRASELESIPKELRNAQERIFYDLSRGEERALSAIGF